MRTFHVLLGVTYLAAFAPAMASGNLFGNVRFGFVVDVPQTFTVRDPEPENGDGQSFRTADGKAELTVSGGWIVEDNFAAEIKQTKGFVSGDGWKITYESKVTESSAAFSASKGARILYERHITTCGSKAHAGYRLEYPAADKGAYNRMIRALNASLEPSVGHCG